MASSLQLVLAALLLLAVAFKFIIEPLYLSPLSRIPGPKVYALTKWRLALDEWHGNRTRSIDQLHRQHGPVVRIGPNEVHFNSLTALRTIFGPGSGFERTDFYRMFDAYGKKNVSHRHIWDQKIPTADKLLWSGLHIRSFT